MADDLITRFRKFQSRSKSGFSELYSRIKENRKFISGEQWDKSDDSFIDKTRNRITLNVLSNQCNSVNNQYAVYPYTWFTGDLDLDKEIDSFFSTDSNRFAVEEALLDCVSFGMGVFALGSDKDVAGREVPVIYSITDPDRVMLDPDSTELDGSDMMEAALVDYRSREWVRVHMGDQYLPSERAKMLVTSASCSTLVPIITYYWIDTDGCHTCTFVNDALVEGSEQTLPIHRIPVFPVWGERTWDGDKQTYQGLIAKAKTVQRIVNYAMTQLVERLALSPKPQWSGYLESFKNLDKYYKAAGKGNNPIIPAQRLANDNKTVLPLPTRTDNTVHFQDVQGIVDGSMGLLTSITGVDSKGLANVEADITATAVNYTSKVFQNNIRHFFSHLRTSFKSLGDTVMVLLGHPDRTVDVAQGPEAYMQNQVARQELTALIGIADPSQKRPLMNALLKTHPDNEILAQLFAELNSIPAPTEMEQQALATVEQMKQAIEGKNQEILQLTAQVEQMKKQMETQDKSYAFDLQKMEMEHRFKMEELALSAQLKGSPADTARAAAEADKARLEVEKTAVELDKEKAKADAQAIETTNKIIEQGMV